MGQNRETISRADGERIRAASVLQRLRWCLDGMELALADHDNPIGYDAGGALMTTATELVVILAKLDAYQRVEKEQKR